MTEKEYKEHIQYTHNAYCRIVIRHASIDAARMLYAKWKREMVYLSFFKRIPQHEIGRRYGYCRSSTGYHIRKALGQLYEEMEGMKHEYAHCRFSIEHRILTMRAAVSRPFYIAGFLIEIGDPAIFLPFCRCTCNGTFTIHQPISKTRYGAASPRTAAKAGPHGTLRTSSICS